MSIRPFVPTSSKPVVISPVAWRAAPDETGRIVRHSFPIPPLQNPSGDVDQVVEMIVRHLRSLLELGEAPLSRR
jgi:hypothetical protein